MDNNKLISNGLDAILLELILPGKHIDQRVRQSRRKEFLASMYPEIEHGCCGGG